MTEEGIASGSQQSRKPHPSTVGQQKPKRPNSLHCSLAWHVALSAKGAIVIVGANVTVGANVGYGVIVGAGETVGSTGSSGGKPAQHIKKIPSMAARTENGNRSNKRKTGQYTLLL